MTSEMLYSNANRRQYNRNPVKEAIGNIEESKIVNV